MLSSHLEQEELVCIKNVKCKNLLPRKNSNDFCTECLPHAKIYNICFPVKFLFTFTDYMMLVSIVDSSLDSLSHKLKCVLFAREQSAFPTQTEVGDIIRMHRLKVKNLFQKTVLYLIHTDRQYLRQVEEPYLLTNQNKTYSVSTGWLLVFNSVGQNDPHL